MATLNSLLFVLCSCLLQAATYSVKSAGGGDYSTVQACANVAVAGDTCVIYAGNYQETVTPANSGSSGNPITFRSNAGDTVVVKRFALVNKTYITINGLEVDNTSGRGIEGGASHGVIVENSYVHSSGGSCILFPGSSPSNDVIVRNNIVYHCGWGNGGSGDHGIVVIGDRALIENNDISYSTDFMNAGGENVVIRNNTCRDVNRNEIPGSSAHIDCLQVTGNTFRYSLIEGNTFKNCSDTDEHCHFFIVRDQAAAAADSIIIRHNFVYNVQHGGAGLGGTGDDVPNAHFYNNTIATEDLTGVNGAGLTFTNAPDGVALNNIFYNTTAGPWSPTFGPGIAAYNIAFQSGYSGSWNSPYSAESTYNTLRNIDPLFSNYPASGALQPSSPALGAGRYLTLVATADTGSGTMLVVDDARFFQPGWAGATADWIRVGSAATAQISSIDYGTNTITLASGITRNDGDPVYLYKNSRGTVVLLDGQAPDIGAFPYIPVGSTTGGPKKGGGPKTKK